MLTLVDYKLYSYGCRMPTLFSIYVCRQVFLWSKAFIFVTHSVIRHIAVLYFFVTCVQKYKWSIQTDRASSMFEWQRSFEWVTYWIWASRCFKYWHLYLYSFCILVWHPLILDMARQAASNPDLFNRLGGGATRWDSSSLIIIVLSTLAPSVVAHPFHQCFPNWKCWRQSTATTTLNIPILIFIIFAHNKHIFRPGGVGSHPPPRLPFPLPLTGGLFPRYYHLFYCFLGIEAFFSGCLCIDNLTFLNIEYWFPKYSCVGLLIFDFFVLPVGLTDSNKVMTLIKFVFFKDSGAVQPQQRWKTTSPFSFSYSPLVTGNQ